MARISNSIQQSTCHAVQRPFQVAVSSFLGSQAEWTRLHFFLFSSHCFWQTSKTPFPSSWSRKRMFSVVRKDSSTGNSIEDAHSFLLTSTVSPKRESWIRTVFKMCLDVSITHSTPIFAHIQRRNHRCRRDLKIRGSSDSMLRCIRRRGQR